MCCRNKETALPRQDKCANPSSALWDILFSYRGKSKDTLSNRKLDKCKKNTYACISTLDSIACIKKSFWVVNASVLFETVHISLMHRFLWIRKIFGTHIRDSENRKCDEIIKSPFT